MTKHRSKINGRTVRSIRGRLLDVDGPACWFCWRECVDGVGQVPLPPDALTLEHIIPYAQGGSHNIMNLVISCSECNNERGDRDFIGYISSWREVDDDDLFRFRLAYNHKEALDRGLPVW